MSQFTIPFEIFEVIAGFLDLKDKIQCALVCKQWLPQFTEFIWKEIKISSQRKLATICDLSNPKNKVYITNGHHVHILELQVCVDATDIQLYALQKCFPNIRRLVLEYEAFIGEDFGKYTNWSLWRSLTEMSLNLDTVDIFIADLEFQKILACVPHLTWLKIVQNKAGDVKSVNPECLEILHKYLQKLKYLSLDLEFEDIADASLDFNPKLTPITSLQTLITPICAMEYRWMYYFATKYPNLRTIKTNSSGPTRQFRMSPVHLPAISTSQDLFKQLTSLDISISNGSIFYLAYWTRVFSLGIPLKHIELNVTEVGTNDPPFAENIIKQCINSYGKLLESLIVNVYGLHSKYWDVLAVLDSYPHLVSLTLRTRHTIIPLDTVLDCYSGLKRLLIDSYQLTTDESLAEIVKPHGLRILGIKNSHFYYNILCYISGRCKNINYMSMSFVHITGPVSPKTGNLYIDMSHTHLKAFVHSNVRYNVSDAVESVENSINFIHLNASSTYPNRRENTKTTPVLKSLPWYKKIALYPRYNNPFTSKSHSKVESDAIWFYSSYLSNWNGVMGDFTWQLEQMEIETALQYFENFSLRKIPVNRGFGNSENINDLRERWKIDLYRGYVTLKLGSVIHYSFPFELGAIDYNWDEEYNAL
ncbi:hypothetical protein F4703DRAFT_1880655, partial [Phycomyces blakesleeanus]